MCLSAVETQVWRRRGGTRLVRRQAPWVKRWELRRGPREAAEREEEEQSIVGKSEGLERGAVVPERGLWGGGRGDPVTLVSGRLKLLRSDRKLNGNETESGLPMIFLKRGHAASTAREVPT
jgi:hypothetical protein